MSKKLIILIALGALFFGTVIAFGQSSFGATALWKISDGGKWLLPLVGVAAAVDSVNPCAFSILLLAIAFLFGIGAVRSRIIKIGGAYIVGIFLVYMLIGLGILGTLHLFSTPHFMAKIGASLLIALGAVNLIGEFFPAFPIRLAIPQAAHAKMAELMEVASVPTAFLLGTLVGLCEFPCTGGPYLMVLGLLHDKATYVSGLGYLSLYNIIFILPLVIILAIASDGALLGKVRAWQKQESRPMRFWGGLAMIALGVLIFFF